MEVPAEEPTPASLPVATAEFGVEAETRVSLRWIFSEDIEQMTSLFSSKIWDGNEND